MATAAAGNWFNMARDIDLTALAKYNKLRDENRSLIQQAKEVERTSLERAGAMYVKAIEAIAAYASINCHSGLVGQLIEEEAAEVGRSGEMEALDQLTIVLTKLGRPEVAARHAESYFSLYRLDRLLSTSLRISKRIEKALGRTRR